MGQPFLPFLRINVLLPAMIIHQGNSLLTQKHPCNELMAQLHILTIPNKNGRWSKPKTDVQYHILPSDYFKIVLKIAICS